MLKNLLAKATGAKERLSGRTDLLEAVCASAAWVAAADGSIEDYEIESCMDAVTNHEILGTAFSSSQISACVDSMLKRAGGGRAGVHGLQKEIKDVVNETEENRELILLIALDVADNDGIEDKERIVLEKISGLLGLKLSDYE